MSKSSKRIISVTIFRVCDTDADTSYLGKYGDRAESEYTIDRAHSEDCASVREDIKQAKQTLEHVQQTIGDLHSGVLAKYNGTLANEKLDAEKDALGDAYDEIGELIDEIEACDCSFSGHWNNREYRYFNPNHENYKSLPEEEIRKYCRQDFDRCEDLNAGNWHYIGIRAEAIIETGSGISQRVSSGGLWGIESDSDASYFAEVQRDELAALKTELIALGFSRRAISTAFKSVQEREG